MKNPPFDWIRYNGGIWDLVSSPGMSGRDGCYGVCDDSEREIKYDPSGHVAQILVHEITHAIRSDDGHSLPISYDEYTRDERIRDEANTCAVAGAIIGFIADNPEMARWLVDEIDRIVNLEQIIRGRAR